MSVFVLLKINDPEKRESKQMCLPRGIEWANYNYNKCCDPILAIIH